MAQKRGKLLQFPINRSRIFYWFAQYRNLKKANGDSIANDWLIRSVPNQLHKQIYELYHTYRLKLRGKG